MIVLPLQVPPKSERRPSLSHEASEWLTTFLRTLPVAISSLCFTILIASKGPPALRHDWSWILDRGDFIRNAWITLVWYPLGIGAPRPYPTDYPLAILNAGLVAIGGADVAFVTFVFAIAIWCASAAAALVRRDEPLARMSLCGFALFNPWVYTEMVAGHVAMVVAYGSLLRLVAEMQKRHAPRIATIALCAGLACVQLQFLLPAAVLTLAWCVAKRAYLPFWTVLVVASPSMLGIAAHWGDIAATAHNLAWERDQSVRPIDALGFAGYFAGYTARFPACAFDAMWSLVALAAIGITARGVPGVVRFGGIAVVAASIAWASGVRGPLPSVFGWAVIHLKVLGVYRELFDVLGFTAIVYLVFAARAVERRSLAIVALIPTVVLVSAWFTNPIADWWVGERELPRPHVTLVADTRVAFVPAIAPLSFQGRGSGGDPDAMAYGRDVVSLNAPDMGYPATTALEKFGALGDPRDLCGLSVSQIASRAWLSTDVGALGPQSALRVSGRAFEYAHRSTIACRAIPELGLVPMIRYVAGPPVIGSGDVFFADASPAAVGSAAAPHIFLAYNDARVASAGWVDVRYAFVASPELGQSLGGVITTNPDRVLDVPPAAAMLVWVRGRLLGTDGSVVSRKTVGYRWVPVANGLRGVRCLGLCVVVATTERPFVPRATERSTKTIRQIRSTVYLPWLVAAVVPASSSESLLRYSIGYDRYLIALNGMHRLEHLRVEGIVNGWVLPANVRSRNVFVIEPIAALQLGLECIAFAAIVALAVRACAPRPGIGSTR